MTHDFQVLEAKFIEDVIAYEAKKLAESHLDENEKMFKSWHAKWRKESLEHYLPLGWSFVARDAQKNIIGYFIAQPLLFIDGFTQALWVEHLQFDSLKIRDELCELAYRMSRDKHLQKVYFPNENSVANSVKSFGAEAWAPATLSVKTTRM